MVQPGSSGDTPEPHQATAPQATTTVDTGTEAMVDTASVDSVADAGWTICSIESTSTSDDPAASLVAMLAVLENDFHRLARQLAEMHESIAEIRRQHQKQ